MTTAYPKLFLTGEPGCGKTTVVRRLVERLRGSVAMTGFYTEEMLEGGKRRGFRGRTLDGDTFPLAEREGPGDFRVGPYVVQTTGLERVGVPALVPGPGTELIVLDEVGKMEAFSPEFKKTVDGLIDGDVPLLATVAVHGVGWIKRVRNHPRITLLRMDRNNRDGMTEEILRRLRTSGIRAQASPETRGG